LSDTASNTAESNSILRTTAIRAWLSMNRWPKHLGQCSRPSFTTTASGHPAERDWNLERWALQHEHQTWYASSGLREVRIGRGD
jgi:hypothetical protein